MKKLSLTLIAILLAVLTAGLTSIHVLAEAPPAVYISEVKTFEGSYDKAEEEGFTLLKGDDGKPVDLNPNAGGKSNRAVYLGYKTTDNAKEAITDLALMNMKGGYSIKDYETLMESHLKSQIIPLVENFLAAIVEYRENYEADVQRAVYLNEILNKFIDDDTGKGLGDLLLNETKFEMGDEAYDKLSEDEKKNHADLLTIVAQANGKAILTMENLITRAADTNDDSWLDRFTETTYDDLVDATGKSPSDAKKQLAKDYDDDANKLLDKWDDFRDGLEQYDDFRAYIEKYEEKKMREIETKINGVSVLDDHSTEEQAVSAVTSYEEGIAAQAELMRALKMMMLHDTLDETETDDGTLLDFFTQSREEIEDDITVLYPMVASLTDGQRAGLEYVSIEELFMIALTEDGAYSEMELDQIAPISIYDGVDRGIYERGAVALTSDALRSDFAEQVEEDNGSLSKWSIASWAITGAMALGAIATFCLKPVFKAHGDHIHSLVYESEADLNFEAYSKVVKSSNGETRVIWDYDVYYMRSSICKWMSVGFTVAMVVMTGVSIYLTVRDMQNKYKVDFTPIPRYIVDEKDITTYNEKSRRPSGLRKTNVLANSLAHRTTWLRSDFDRKGYAEQIQGGFHPDPALYRR